MKQIKFFVIALIAMALMPGCNSKTDTDRGKDIDSVNTELQDALEVADAEKDSLLALMNEINQGMLQIKQMQDIVTVQDLSQETPDRKQQLRADMDAIQKAISERQKKLADLERRLSQSDSYTKELKSTIDGLKAQLATQQSIIDDLNQRLAAAHAEIESLNTQVDSLTSVNKAEREQKNAAQEENARLTEDVNELNTCYYAIGTEKELKEHRIIEKKGLLRNKTKIMEGDYEKNYFTKADKRVLNEIDLHSKKAEVLTKHPKDSYTIVEAGGTQKLVISNSKRFWEQNNFLVVKIN
ncbi:MAG: hypothetical protein IJT30_02975 [Muribaculaceae bacterium]|nr:hypothetical protein [Muribaculaceae bacterium]